MKNITEIVVQCVDHLSACMHSAPSAEWVLCEQNNTGIILWEENFSFRLIFGSNESEILSEYNKSKSIILHEKCAFHIFQSWSKHNNGRTIQLSLNFFRVETKENMKLLIENVWKHFNAL